MKAVFPAFSKRRRSREQSGNSNRRIGTQAAAIRSHHFSSSNASSRLRELRRKPDMADHEHPIALASNPEFQFKLGLDERGIRKQYPKNDT
jgi:hypothetical protein